MPQKAYGSLSINAVPMTTVDKVQKAAARAGLHVRAWILRAIAETLAYEAEGGK